MDPLMRNTKIITIIQEVLVPHTRIVRQTWHDRVERLIEREIDTEGTMVNEEVVGEEIWEPRCDFEEVILEADENLEGEEIMTERFHNE
jgi:hypothetical protein